MATDDDPIAEIDATCTTLPEALVREFSCACCRRVWGLIDDERVWRAIEVAERHADSGRPPEDLDHARAEVSGGIKARAREEWEAEARARFSYTPSYCVLAARLYATMAAWYTLSRSMASPDPDPHLVRPDARKQSSWYWAAAAVESLARSDALRLGEEAGSDDAAKFATADDAARSRLMEEHHEQREILRRMVAHRGSAGRSGGEDQT